ncbi:MAG: hypothetical protein CMB56_003085 [Methanobacteriota archaeon]|nr:MAG: hypothetical protein CMB56_003085 [Euryarchaeota archaeon]|tara:strand:+ start:7054 stop:7677 length:624 start_codon:yes stop_codon:yes gene_type:complete
MKDSHLPEDHGSGEVESISLPDSVMRMWDLMLAVDPKWDFREWLHERAVDELELLAIDLKKEKLRASQKIFRLDNLSRRLSPPKFQKDNYQTNLFDVFDFETKNIDDTEKEDESYEPSFLRHLSELFNTNKNIELPDDDPLLAVTSQIVLMELEKAKSKDKGALTINQITSILEKRDISIAEIEEAINFLLCQEKIVEIDDDVFMAT